MWSLYLQTCLPSTTLTRANRSNRQKKMDVVGKETKAIDVNEGHEMGTEKSVNYVTEANIPNKDGFAVDALADGIKSSESE